MNTANTSSHSVFCDITNIQPQPQQRNLKQGLEEQQRQGQSQSTAPSIHMASPSFGMVLQVPVQVGNKNTDEEGSDIINTTAPFLSPVTVDSSNSNGSPSKNPFKKNLFSSGDGALSPNVNKGLSSTNKEVHSKKYEKILQEEAAFFDAKADEIRSCLNGTILNMPKLNASDSRRKSTNYDSPTRTCSTNITTEDEKMVDLWHLRQLALSRGGLLDASNRKRAWLKLVNANEHILTSSIGLHVPSEDGDHKGSLVGLGSNNSHGTDHVTLLSDDEINLIQHDIRNCIWDIEAGINQSRKARDLQKRSRYLARMQARQQGHASNDDACASVASFTSGMTSSTTGGRITPHLIPESIRAFPRDVKFQSPLRDDESGASVSTCTPASNSNITPSSKPVSMLYSPRRGKKHCSKEEQSLLLNIITSVLRTIPEELTSKREHNGGGGVTTTCTRLHYFQGMHNVAAPILINLESPSLTSLVLKRLSTYHLRDAMAPTFMNVQVGIRAFFMPLLKQVDQSIHDLLVSGGIMDPCTFSLPWILCWFANDIANCQIISRIFDVFFASHASCPIYMSVALLASPYNRTRIEEAMEMEVDQEARRTVLYNLPTSMIENMGTMESVNVFENIIESTLSYMRSFPPDKVISLAKEYSDERVSSSVYILDTVTMTKDPPTWALKSTAPTDWALIREARTMRDLSPISRMARQASRKEKLSLAEEERIIHVPNTGTCTTTPSQYQLALDASGLEEEMKSSMCGRNRKSSLRMYMRMHNALILCALMILCAYTYVTFHLDAHHHTVELSMPVHVSLNSTEEFEGSNRISRHQGINYEKKRIRVRQVRKRISEKRRNKNNIIAKRATIVQSNESETLVVEECQAISDDFDIQNRHERVWKKRDIDDEAESKSELDEVYEMKNDHVEVEPQDTETERQLNQTDRLYDNDEEYDHISREIIQESESEMSYKAKERLRRIWNRLVKRNEKERSAFQHVEKYQDDKAGCSDNSGMIIPPMQIQMQQEDMDGPNDELDDGSMIVGDAVDPIAGAKLRGWDAVKDKIQEYVKEDPNLYIMVM